MCRWLAFVGDSTPIENLLLRPKDSLVFQSLHAIDMSHPVNGDGFGVGWYKRTRKPGLFRDLQPAWNDQNLRSLAKHIDSGLFLAHIRATSGSPVTRVNNHPFRYGHWLFQQNGEIEGFDKVRHALDCQIESKYYETKEGSTDTETMFLLALTFGLEDDARSAMVKMIECVNAARKKVGLNEAFTITTAASDGESIYASRYSTDSTPPSLFHRSGATYIEAGTGKEIAVSNNCHLIVSEPLDNVSQDWDEIPTDTFLTARRGDIQSQPLFS